MDRFRELTTFVAVAEAGAFNAAARRLKMSPPAVTRQVTALETRLGVQLFTRTTRRVALTEAGARLREDALKILAELEESETAVRGTTSAPRGHLRLTAPVLFGQRFLAPVLRDYLDAYPEVTAEALFIDRNVSLLDEGLDVALRIGALPDSSLSARRVGSLRRIVVAAPAYLERHGTPETPEALRDHRLVFPTSVSEVPNWTFTLKRKRRVLRLAPRLSVNSLQTAIDAAQDGWGITRVLSYQVSDALAEGRLVEVLGAYDDEEIPIHLLHAEGRRPAAKTRSFIDLATARLQDAAEHLLARQSAAAARGRPKRRP